MPLVRTSPRVIRERDPRRRRHLAAALRADGYRVAILDNPADVTSSRVDIIIVPPGSSYDASPLPQLSEATTINDWWQSLGSAA